MNDDKTYVLVKQHVKSGETVWNGYMGGDMYCTAPPLPENGTYALYEIVGENNTHEGWWWERE